MRRSYLLGSLLIVGIVAALFVWDRYRPRAVPDAFESGSEIAAKTTSADKVSDPLPAFDQPDQFAMLCEKVTESYRAIDERWYQSEHDELQTDIELDSKGNKTSERKSAAHVWFEKGKERRRSIDAPKFVGQSVGGKDLPAAEKQDLIYPFSKEATTGSYRYEPVGYDQIDGAPVFKIRYEPNQPIAKMLSGYIWVDVRTFEPVRFDGRIDKPRFGVDYVQMRVEYGRDDAGVVRHRRWISEGEGGFAFYRRRARVEIDYQNYRPQVEQPAKH